MKRIAFVLRMYQEQAFHGGGEKLFHNLIKRFRSDGYKVDIYCSQSDVEADFVKIIDEPYDHNNPSTMEKFYAKAREQIKTGNYDAVISENITPPVDITFLQGHSLINRLKKAKSPLEAFLYNFRKVKRERIKYQKKWMNNGYRKVFVVSEVLKLDIVENFKIDKDKINVIYPGVDMPCHPEFDSEAPETPHQVRGDNCVFGLLAPGFKIKGGFEFLHALGQLKQQGYKFKARIIYPKHHKNMGVRFLMARYSLQKEVEFLGYQRELAEFYHSIDCLVAPSIEDTFNLAALEAMSYGKPVIISTNAGAHEIITEGKNGFVYSGGAEQLAEKLAHFLDRKPHLAWDCRKTAQEFSWDRTYQEVLKALGF